jgi:hypothetical protein
MVGLPAMRWRTPLLCSLTLAGLACATPAAPPAPAPVAADAPGPLGSDCARRVCVRATLVEGGAGQLDVELSVPDAALPAGAKVVQFPFFAEPFKAAPEGYVAFISQGEGPFSEQVEPLPGGRRLRYRVALEHAAKDPAHGLDEVPHRTAQGWLLVGRAFIPLIKVDGVVQEGLPTELRLEVGERPLVTLAGEEAGDARVGTLGGLAHALYYVGPHHERVVRQGATIVRILSQDYDAAGLEPLAELVQRSLREAERALGPAPHRTRLVIYDKQPLGFAGGVIGGDITLMSSTPPSASGLSPVGAVVVHELSHLWLTADQPWLSEGFNTYLELIFGIKVDGADEARIQQEILRAYAKYQANASGAGPVRGAAGLHAYTGGAMVAFCLDARLEGAGSSVPDVLRVALVEDGGGTTVARFHEALTAVSAPAAAYLDALLDQAEPLDFGTCLSDAGFDQELETYDGFTLRSLVVDVLQITGFSPQRAEVFRVKDGSVFQVGDVIRRVAGQDILLVPEIDGALAHVKPGAAVEVEVERAGKAVKLTLPVPKLDPKARESHRRLKLRAKSRPLRPAP